MERPPTSPIMLRQLTCHKWRDAQEFMVETGMRLHRVQSGPGDYEYLLVKKGGRMWRVIRHHGVTYVFPSD